MGSPPPGNPPNPPRRLEELVVTATSTVWPTSMLSMSVLSTETSTSNRPLLTTWIWAVEEDEPVDWFADGSAAVEPPPVAEERPEPVPDPVRVVPPCPPLDNSSPTVRSTLATVPSKVATSDAPASASVAVARVSLAVAICAMSAAICSSDASASWSSASFASASATADSADVTAAASSDESIVASTCPAVTVSPAVTFTAVTVPDDEKLRSSVWAAATVPSADTVSFMEPLVTSTSWFADVTAAVVGVVVVSSRMPNHQTATAISAIAGMTTKG